MDNQYLTKRAHVKKSTSAPPKTTSLFTGKTKPTNLSTKIKSE